MSRPFLAIAVLPHHLTTREAPAMASLLLGSFVVTAVPAPASGDSVASARAAAAQAPAYRGMVRSWAWSEALWREGVLTGGLDGEAAIDEVQAAASRVARDPACRALLPLMRGIDPADEAAYLNTLAADLLKGGPDPGVLLPVSAGLDRFAARHGLIVARSAPSSLAQKAEARLAPPSRPVALPVFLQADASRLLHAREVLLRELEDLRAELIERDADLAHDPGAEARPALERAAGAYAAAFDSSRGELFDDAPGDEVRAVEGVVSITLARLPIDAVLRSSVAALHESSPRAAGPPSPMPVDPVLHDPAEARGFTAMTIRALGSPAR